MALADILAALPRVRRSLPEGPIDRAIEEARSLTASAQDLARAAGEAAVRSVDWEAALGRGALPSSISIARHYAVVTRELLEALLAAQEFVKSRRPMIPLCEGVPVTGGRSRALFRLLHALSDAEEASGGLAAFSTLARSAGPSPFRRAEELAQEASLAADRNMDVLERDRRAFEYATHTQMLGQVGGPW